MSLSKNADFGRQSAGAPGITAVATHQDCRQYGVPPVFAVSVGQVTAKWGNTISIRASDPIPKGLYSQPGQPKSIDTHVKSSNWGFAEGFAPADARMDRVQTNGELRQRAAGDLPMKDGKVNLETHPLKKRLEDVLFQINSKPPKYKMLDDAETIQKTGILRVSQITDKPGAVADTIFAINLLEKSEEKNPPKRRLSQIDLEGGVTANLSEPTWWKNPPLGDFNTKLSTDFQAYFSTKNADGVYTELTELKVFGKNNLPIVRDVDLYSVSKPKDLSQVLDTQELDTKELEKDLHTQHNTTTVAGTAALIQQLLIINYLEKNNANKILPSFSPENSADQFDMSKAMDIMSKYIACLAKSPDKSSAKIGTCTAFEVYQMMEINCLVAKKTFSEDAQLNNFIQHGAENRNTGYTQPDGPTITISDANIFAATSGNVTAKNLMSDSVAAKFPGTHYVNPNWAPGSALAQPAWINILKKQAEQADPDSQVLLKKFEAPIVEPEPQKQAIQLNLH